jgi:hypothetical protein
VSRIFISSCKQKIFRFALSPHTINTNLFALYTALNGDLESIYHAVAVLEALKCGEKASDDVTKKISAGLSGNNVVDFYRAVATWEALQSNVSTAFIAPPSCLFEICLLYHAFVLKKSYLKV